MVGALLNMTISYLHIWSLFSPPLKKSCQDRYFFPDRVQIHITKNDAAAAAAAAATTTTTNHCFK